MKGTLIRLPRPVECDDDAFDSEPFEPMTFSPAIERAMNIASWIAFPLLFWVVAFNVVRGHFGW